MKKLLSIFLCVVMVCSLSVTAFAVPEDCCFCDNLENCSLNGVADVLGETYAICQDCYDKYYCSECDCLVLEGQSHKAGCSTLFALASEGTKVTFTGTQSESYTVTVPASVTVKASGDAVKGQVTVAGTWASNRKVVVTADETVTLTNSISGGDPKTLDIEFGGIGKLGDNNVAIETTDDGASAIFTVANITDALFGTWTGKFNYTVGIEDFNGYKLTITSDGHANIDAYYSVDDGEYKTLSGVQNITLEKVHTVKVKIGDWGTSIKFNDSGDFSKFPCTHDDYSIYTIDLTQDSILECSGYGVT